MLNLFRKPQPAEPLDISADVEIDRCVDTVFDLIDFESPNFMLLARGYGIVEHDREARVITFSDPHFPDMHHQFSIMAHVPGEELHYISRTICDAPCGLLNWVRTEVTLTALESDRCRATYSDLVHFQPFKSKRLMAEHYALYTRAMYDAMMKIKIQAEDGAEAVIALEKEMGEAPDT